MPSRSETKKHDVLARLARNEVVALRHQRNRLSASETQQQAFARYARLYWPRLAPEDIRHPDPSAPAWIRFEAMRQRLAQGRLTINFDCCTRLRSKTGRRSALRAPPDYPDYQPTEEEHDALELEFGSYGRKRHLPGVRHAWLVQDRIANYALRTSDDFRPLLRPYYAMLDFAHYPGGGFCRAGESYLVLQDHLKLNATYLPTLSPLVNADLHARRAEYGNAIKTLDDVTATYLDLDRLLLYCPPVLLDALHRQAQSPDDVGLWDSGKIGNHGIEAHIYADILLSRDIKSMVVELNELRQGPGRALLYQRTPCRENLTWSKRDFERTLKALASFARKHRIPIEFI